MHRDPKELFSVLVRELHRVVPFDYIGVTIRDEKSNTFHRHSIDADVVQLVRTLPRHWLESHTVTAISLTCSKKRTIPSLSPPSRGKLADAAPDGEPLDSGFATGMFWLSAAWACAPKPEALYRSIVRRSRAANVL
jgi:hypothetical protein